MKFVNVKELKNKTSEILHYTENGKDIVVTLRGKPFVLLHHLSEDDLEDYILLNHPEFKKKLAKAYHEYVDGKILDIDDYIQKTEKELGRI